MPGTKNKFDFLKKNLLKKLIEYLLVPKGQQLFVHYDHDCHLHDYAHGNVGHHDDHGDLKHVELNVKMRHLII